MTQKEFFDKNYGKTDMVSGISFYRAYWESEGDTSHLQGRYAYDEAGQEYYDGATEGSQENPYVCFYPDLIARGIDISIQSSYVIKSDLDFNNCEYAPFGITSTYTGNQTTIYGQNHSIKNLVFNKTLCKFNIYNAVFENFIVIGKELSGNFEIHNSQIGLYLLNCNLSSNGVFRGLTDSTINMKGIINNSLKLFQPGDNERYRNHIKLDLFINNASIILNAIDLTVSQTNKGTFNDSYITGEIRAKNGIQHAYNTGGAGTVELSNTYFSVKVDAPSIGDPLYFPTGRSNSGICFINKSLLSGYENDQEVNAYSDYLYAFPESICKNPTILRETYGFPVFEEDDS